MGDFNSQPNSLPIAILRSHASLDDSFLSTHPSANTSPTLPPSHQTALSTYGMTCDSPINTYSQSKPIPHEVSSRGGKRLDYIFYRQPEIARRRPLIWGYRDNSDNNGGGQGAGGHIEEGKPIQQSLLSAPKLRCIKSEVVMTEIVPGQAFSFSDHFGVHSTFHIEDAKSKVQASRDSSIDPSVAAAAHGTFSPLVPLMIAPEPLSDTTTTFAPIDLRGSTSRLSSNSSVSSNAKSPCIRSALSTLRMYARIAQQTSHSHLRYFLTAVICLLGLTIGSAWQPRPWIQPIFTLLAGALGAGGATMLYTGFVWGRWEEGILKEVMEEMELELRVVEMEENLGRS